MRKNKNPAKERNRELTFFVWKKMYWIGEIKPNLYKINWEKEE